MNKLILIAAAAVVLTTGTAQAAKVNPNLLQASQSGATGPKITTACRYKAISVAQEKQMLGLAGYTKIKYIKTTTFQPRCAQFVRFKACKAAKRYKVSVRYIKGTNRYVIAQSVGNCLKLKMKKLGS
ncbi:hypothetical protein MNBD_ALPHA08-327 [hydrothermal vent metagenome]|uniref:Uncharacterized protein n=1 Tax=hydrothermal vent metagenome TaxID=652676 RepID=A0A3B0SG45_9ZZZZ